MVELGIFHSTQNLGARRGTNTRTADDLKALVGVDVPNTNCAVARSSDDLLLIELNTVDRVGVTGQVDTLAALIATSPVLVDTSSSVVHQFPMLHRLVRESSAGATDLDRCRRHISLLLVLSKVLSTPDKGILSDARPALGDPLGSLKTLGVEVRED